MPPTMAPDGAADAAEHDGGEAFQRQQRASIVAGERNRRDQNARNRADGRRQRETGTDDDTRVNSHKSRGHAVGGGRDHCLAEQRSVDEGPQQHHNDQRTGEYNEALGENGGTANADRITAE